MMKALAVGAVGAMLCFFAPSPAVSQETPEVLQPDAGVSAQEALPEDEVRKLFKGNTEVGEGRKGDIDTGRRWTAFYAADGTVRKRESASGTVTGGTWFIDPEGRNCFRWEHKERTKCDFIVSEGDYYLRLREGQVRGRIRFQEGNPSKL